MVLDAVMSIGREELGGMVPPTIPIVCLWSWGSGGTYPLAIAVGGRKVVSERGVDVAWCPQPHMNAGLIQSAWIQ